MERFLFTSLKGDGECCGVTFNECHILMELQRNKEVSVTELSDKLGIDKSLISRALEGLVKKQLIIRTESPEDRRRKIISLSPSGQEKTDWIDCYVNQKYRLLFKELGDSESQKILGAVHMLADQFTKWMNRKDDCPVGGVDECCG